LKPKKYKELIKKVAKEKEYNEELMTEAVSFFYSSLRKALSSLEDSKILVPKLGTFAIRKMRMNKMIEEKERLVEKLNPHVFNKYDSYRKHSEDLKKLEALKQKIDKQDEERKNFYSKKK
jgi:nucleoid DNA-binding protein